ncbi:MAG TPA: 4-hydroxybenzoate 3-monooxygenase, partial [Gaiellaceae bacterium]|nr:4-hydroxybenzoate 3-monooxygenase [Gaiellaceae bacterium]
GLTHHGIWLRFEGENHYVPMTELTGRSITVYGQQEVVKDLIAARLESGLPLLFEAEAVVLEEIEERPLARFRIDGSIEELECDVIAGCDGFHGICRPAIPAGVLTEYSREYPFGWLGILAQVAPATEELIYAWNDSGFALHSMRSPELSRLYLQCRPDEDIDDWSDDRIWSELQARLGLPGFEGPIVERGVTPMRSYVVEPMQHGRLFLAGDAAHIVPPTGAKGLNLAVRDVAVLADALVRWYADGDESGLASYSERCLRRVWRAEHFSWFMTSMLHRHPGADPFEAKLQLSQLRYVTTSESQARALAENYVGLQRV